MAIASSNPATGEVEKTFSPLSREEIEAKLRLAQTAFGTHARVATEQRAAWLGSVAATLEKEKLRLATIAVREMGKPIRQATAEVEKCAAVCRYYSEHAAAFLNAEPVRTEARQSYVRYEPLGAVLAIMPWNFPYWQVFRFAAPAIAAGNVGLLKHASNVPQCALAIEQLISSSGVPDGIFQTLLVESAAVPQLIDDPRVAAVTLTGSEAAGAEVAAQAGRNIKKTVLELGGSDAFVVLPSADVEAAADAAVQARIINNGQSCIAAKRFIVSHTVAEEFRRRMLAGFSALVVGDPLDERTQIGPLVSRAALETLDDQVRRLVAGGARILAGGSPLDRPGYYYAPTIVDLVEPRTDAAQEELFGPVALLLEARDAAHAVQLANSTCFGLGASIWTNDSAEVERFVPEIQAGVVFVNAMVKSDPRLPFGGVKRSGYGRELGVWGMREFVNVKSVWIER